MKCFVAGRLLGCRRFAPLALRVGLIASLAGCAVAWTGVASAIEEKKIPEPEDVSLATSDGLQLAARYYGSNAGKAAIPVILLHGWKGNRGDFDNLALELQKRECAVIVPDLRGHGESTQVKATDGTTRVIKPEIMHKADFQNMARDDMEAIKTFLMEKNNKGELNIEKLCVVGYEMGAVVAANWAVWDWHWPTLTTVKQGKDVKALVLIAPPMNFKGYKLTDALTQQPLAGDDDCSVAIITGDHPSGDYSIAKQIYTKLGAKRMKSFEDEKEQKDKQTLFFVPLQEVSLQKVDVLNDPAVFPSIAADIEDFINLRLKVKKFAWTNRKSVND